MSIASKFKLEFDCVQHVCWFLTFSMKICKFACRPEYVTRSLMSGVENERERENRVPGIVGRRKETNCTNFSKSPRADLMWDRLMSWKNGRACIYNNRHSPRLSATFITIALVNTQALDISL